MYTTDFAYDGPIFLVPSSPSYPSSPVVWLSYAGVDQGASSWFEDSNNGIVGETISVLLLVRETIMALFLLLAQGINSMVVIHGSGSGGEFLCNGYPWPYVRSSEQPTAGN